MTYLLESFAWVLALAGLGQVVGWWFNDERVLND